MMIVVQNDVRCPAGMLEAVLEAGALPWRTVQAYREPLPELDATVQGVIVLGGYMGVGDVHDYPYLRDVKSTIASAVARDIPLLGICLGAQLLAESLGGQVQSHVRGEKGVHTLQPTENAATDPIFSGLPAPGPVFQWHDDSFDLPPGATHLMASDGCAIQAFRLGNAYGVQFHPEVDRKIVQEWTRNKDPQGTIIQQFDSAQAGIRAFSARLLERFVSFAADT